MDTIGIISTVKAPTSQLCLFVNYHLNIGIDHIVLFFDDPDDVAIKTLAQYPKVTIIKCSNEYWEEISGDRPKSIEERQKVNVNHGFKYLLKASCKWLVHIDCDELLNPLKNLKDILRKCQTDEIRFTVLEAVAEKEKYDNIFLPSLFKKQGSPISLILAKKLGFLQAMFDGEYFRAHTASKTAVRIAPEFKGKYGIHGLRNSPNATYKNTNLIQLLHFDCVTIDDWKLKWNRRVDKSGLALGMRTNRKKQMELYINAEKKGDDYLSLLFERMHNIRKIERPILYVLGLLTRIDLDKKLFDEPHDEAKKVSH